VVVVNDISHAIRDQSAASNDIAQNVERVAQMSGQSALGVREMTGAAHRLQTLAASLQEATGRFQV
jgi:methyl-accepting chemotaxis protein